MTQLVCDICKSVITGPFFTASVRINHPRRPGFYDTCEDCAMGVRNMITGMQK